MVFGCLYFKTTILQLTIKKQNIAIQSIKQQSINHSKNQSKLNNNFTHPYPIPSNSNIHDNMESKTNGHIGENNLPESSTRGSIELWKLGMYKQNNNDPMNNVVLEPGSPALQNIHQMRSNVISQIVPPKMQSPHNLGVGYPSNITNFNGEQKDDDMTTIVSALTATTAAETVLTMDTHLTATTASSLASSNSSATSSASISMSSDMYKTGIATSGNDNHNNDNNNDNIKNIDDATKDDETDGSGTTGSYVSDNDQSTKDLL